MGLEVALIASLAMSVVGAAQGVKTAKSQARATVAQGELAAKEKAKETRFRAARQQVSFLNSGLTLEGTPTDVLGETFATGLADVNQIRTNANIQSKNIIGQARSQAISSIGSAIGGAAMGGAFGSAGSMFSQGASYLPDSSLFAMNNAGMGNTAFEAFELKDLRGG